MAARRSTSNASTEARLQVFSPIIAAPAPIRARFRGQKLAATLNTAASLRVHASWDTETASTVVAPWRHGAGRPVASRTDPLRGGLREARRRGTHPGQQRSGHPSLRLNRYGDRQLNNSLHTVVQIRIQYQQSTRDYIARRTAERKTSREIERCLTRYVADDRYRLVDREAAAA